MDIKIVSNIGIGFGKITSVANMLVDYMDNKYHFDTGYRMHIRFSSTTSSPTLWTPYWNSNNGGQSRENQNGKIPIWLYLNLTSRWVYKSKNYPDRVANKIRLGYEIVVELQLLYYFEMARLVHKEFANLDVIAIRNKADKELMNYIIENHSQVYKKMKVRK